MAKLKPCPFCGGEIEERSGQCNYGKKIMTMDLKCEGCGTIFKFKSKWEIIPYQEAIEAWNRRAVDGNDYYKKQSSCTTPDGKEWFASGGG